MHAGAGAAHAPLISGCGQTSGMKRGEKPYNSPYNIRIFMVLSQPVRVYLSNRPRHSILKQVQVAIENMSKSNHCHSLLSTITLLVLSLLSTYIHGAAAAGQAGNVMVTVRLCLHWAQRLIATSACEVVFSSIQTSTKLVHSVMGV